MKKIAALIFLILFIIGVLVGFSAGFFYPHPKEIKEEKTARMWVPAVRANGSGMLAELIVTVKPGTGQILVSINNVLAGFDTQSSAKTAAKVASNFTGISLDDVDVVYSIKANASSIEGPSAGAAMAIATIAALKGVKLNNSVIMTGSIHPDGTISKASGLEGKVKAAEKAGMLLFLLPAGETISASFEKQKRCKSDGIVTYCILDYVKGVREFNITIKEVSNIDEAWRYFSE